MSILFTILIVLFIIVSLLLVFIVSIQDEKQSGLSGVFAGKGGSAFGSQTSSVITKFTSILAVIFFALALGIAFMVTRTTDNDPLFNVEVPPAITIVENEVPETSSQEVTPETVEVETKTEEKAVESSSESNETVKDASQTSTEPASASSSTQN